MKYQAVTFDNQIIVFDQSFLAQVEKAMKDKTPFRISGKTYIGSDIRRIEAYKEQGANFGNGLQAEVEAIFLSAGPKQGMGFWETIFRENMARKNKRWLFKSAILAVKEDTALTKPLEIIAYLDEHWDDYKDLNIADESHNPAYEAEVAQLTKEFYATEKGKEYYNYIRKFGVN